MQLNNSDNYESIKVTLSKEKTPIAYENKVQCLMQSGLSREEAEAEVEGIEIELELYYKVGAGLFAVEAEAVSGGADIYEPYSGELMDDFIED